ncbi:MAG: hypothetical protein WCQ95_07875 [Bacteroidota bacterium]
MLRWIKDNFGIKNLLILTTVILVITGFLVGPSLYRKLIGNQYKGTAKAEVTNIVVKKTLSQHLNGTNESITGYDVTYVYSNQSKNYSNTEFIKPDQDVKRLYDKVTAGETCFVEIKYSLDTPSESLISKLNLN